MTILKGQLVDIHQRAIYPAAVHLSGSTISKVERLTSAEGPYLLPGFVDAHVHIESSMLIPSEFARLAVRHGTVATVSDPHEIANVLGEAGVEYMIANGQQVPFHFFFGAPSCVPATTFETAGATIDAAGVARLLQRPEIKYLAEMMNYPGVLQQDAEVMAKIAAAHRLGKPVDGHAPGLRGEQARQYAAAGISTDHECFTYEEGLDKIRLGMKIAIREGSAARNFEALIPLLREFPDQIMFCSDDKHPDSLLEGHINQLVARAVAQGYALFDVLRAACLHPVQHYNLGTGLLRAGDSADFILVNDLSSFEVEATYIKGQCVARQGQCLIPSQPAAAPNYFQCTSKQPADFALPASSEQARIIHAKAGALVTEQFTAEVRVEQGLALSDPDRDLLKLTVINRYQEAPPALAFIHGFGLKRGALASCVGHDSHNIIAVGTDDASLCRAVNLVIANKGGISAVSETEEQVLPLPVAGIMTTADGFETAKNYQAIDRFARQQLGCTLEAPFMALSFMALLVIPELKLSDKGLFDGSTFAFVPVFV